MPGAASPFLDTWAPAQYVAGSSGGQGPLRSPDPVTAVTASIGSVIGVNGSSYDNTLEYKIAGTIIIALLVVFGLQLAGFRFVGAVNVGFGK